MEALHLDFLRRMPEADFYVDLPYWGYALAALLLVRCIPAATRVRDILLLVCNVALLLSLPQFSYRLLAVVLGICITTFLFARILLASVDKTFRAVRVSIAAAGIGLVLLALFFFKYPAIQSSAMAVVRSTAEAPGSFIFLIGISYSSFKAMHVIIEAYKGALVRPQLLDLLNYVLFFPSFISGPINRYNHFVENSPAGRRAPAAADLKEGSIRIIQGLFKKSVLAVALFPYTIGQLDTPLAETPLWRLLLSVWSFGFFFYFDFAGYTDLAIGTGRLFGYVLPENFDSPLTKKNLQQFWANWHISLTGWLTDYIYWPLIRSLRNYGFFSRHPVLLSNTAIVITFAACGMWHGNTLRFLYWGLYHGVGVALVNTYQVWKRKVRRPAARKYFASKWSYGVGVVATFHFYALGTVIGFYTGDLLALVHRIF